MKRGLKHSDKLDGLNVHLVEESAPMKRGLKQPAQQRSVLGLRR